MLIESITENLLKTLNLGCFPKNVLDFQDSQDFFQQLIFIDYQLQLLIQNEFDGTELVPVDIYHTKEKDSCREKLTQLIGYAELVASNYSSINTEYHEKLYSSIILAHLYYLNSQYDLTFEVLNSITVNNNHYNSLKLSRNQNNFLNYLICRYNVLLGVLDSSNSLVNPVNDSHKLWIEYLFLKERPFYKTEVAANYWLEILFKYLSLKISSNGEHQLSFDQVLALKFRDNKNSFLRFCNFLLNFKNDINVNRIIDKHFTVEYSKYLNTLILDDLNNDHKNFPNANENNDEIDDFISSFYSTIGNKHKRLINLKTSKKYLIRLTERSYQSQPVLIQFIKVLLELGEYDEAYGAFKCLVTYVDKDEKINKGHIEDLLSIVDIYTICLTVFNPFFAPKTEKFKYFDDRKMSLELLKISGKLEKYLDILKKDCDLSYDVDEEFNKLEKNPLSFLYNKYNTNILLDDRSMFINLLSSSWYCIGYAYYYLLNYRAATQDISAKYQAKLLLCYKNSLIVNSTGNLTVLFNYALSLAYSNQLNPSLKLCKFILKKYPESFKTWNLLALNSSIENTKEAEKFINNALNIAGIYIIKCKNDESIIPVNIKKEILQLKFTQMAIWEKIHGVSYLMENLGEIFILYYELFDIKYEEQIKNGSQKDTIDCKWSHRPSFIDPKSNKDGIVNTTKKQHAKNNIKKISKINNTKNDVKPVTHKVSIDDEGKEILQDIWLWTSMVYFKIGMHEESELCIIESENIFKPNIKTYIALGFLTSKQTKFLSLQEFEKSLEKLEEYSGLNKKDELQNLLGLCKLFLIDDTVESSLFISDKDLTGGYIRLKNYLEGILSSWPIGSNCVEVWYYLSLIYEKFDDKILLNKCLRKCIDLENMRPVRNFHHCDDNFA